MIVTLTWNDIVTVLRSIPAIVTALPWWIKYEKQLRETWLFPYLFIEKIEMPTRHAFNKQAFVTFWIEWDSKTKSKDIELVFNTIDNAIMSDVDWCLPIQSRWDVVVSDIYPSYIQKPFRDTKQNITILKDYVFTYVIQDV